MREVGPAGRLLMELRDRGRRMRARIMGGMRRVGGRVARRNDWSGSQLEEMSKIGTGPTANLREPQRRSITRS